MPRKKIVECRVRIARLVAGYDRLGPFAQKIKITYNRLSEIENGQVEPRISEAQRIAMALPGETTDTLWPAENGRKRG